jgi:hypothetical protein
MKDKASLVTTPNGRSQTTGMHALNCQTINDTTKGSRISLFSETHVLIGVNIIIFFTIVRLKFLKGVLFKVALYGYV